jgi:putative SOS response-associated peptidase YedK
MCIKLKSSGDLEPGKIFPFHTNQGMGSGLWGLFKGTRYNARFESLSSTWRDIEGNRAIVEVDSFWEKEAQIAREDSKLLHLAIVYNDLAEFAVITRPANDIVSPYHHRMPLVLDTKMEYLWLGGADLSLITFDNTPQLRKIA